MNANEMADSLSPSAKAVLLGRAVSPSAGLSFCRGSEELERLGLWDRDGQLSDLGREARDRLVLLARFEAGEEVQS